MLVAVLTLQESDQPSDTAGMAPGECVPIGQLSDGVAQEANAARISERLHATFDGAGGEEQIGCGTGAAYRWQSLVVQETILEGVPTVPTGALVLSPNGADLYFNRAAWGSYFQLGGKDGSAAQTQGGLPVRMMEYRDGHVEIELSTGTILVAEREDAPYFWIPSAYVSWWRDHPELGLPVSNPLASLRQEFEKGIGSITPAGPGRPVPTVVDNPAGELPAIDTIRERILRHADGTAWYISQEGERRWIPDGGTWVCLGGDELLLGRDLPGYAIATLPFGGQATCPA